MFARAYIAAVALIAVSLPAWAEKRVALVIGNSVYEAVSDLENPRRDALAVASELRRLGFETELLMDQDLSGMIGALGVLRKRAFGAEQAVFYYAGHGIEIDRSNFLIPVDAALRSDLDVEYESAPLSLAMQAVSGAAEMGLVVLDACRDNPFLQSMNRSAATRSVGRGLSPVEPQGATLVSYAARDGTVALDGTGDNSPFALAFLKALRTDGLEVGKFFRQVRDDVIAATGSLQEPFLYGSLPARDIFLNPPDAAAPAPAAPVAAAPPPAAAYPAPGAAIEAAFWQSIASSRTPADFEDYLARYPDGAFRSLAERRLAALREDSRMASLDPAAVAALRAEDRASPRANAAPAAEVPDADTDLSPFTPSRAQIRDAQERLNALGHDAGVPDGLPGPRTRAALRAFQRAVGLPVDGVLDPAALDALRREADDATLAAWRDAQAETARRAREEEARRAEAAAAAAAETDARRAAEAEAARAAARAAAAQQAQVAAAAPTPASPSPAAPRAEAPAAPAVALRPPSRPVFGHKAQLMQISGTEARFEMRARQPVRAAMEGVVTEAVRVSGGWAVSIAHPQGPVMRYFPMPTRSVEPGQRVARGDIIGRSTGPATSGVTFEGRPEDFFMSFSNISALPHPDTWF